MSKVEKPKKLNASKDECRKAIVAIDNLAARVKNPADCADCTVIKEFLAVCLKRLPTEKAIAADKERKKQERKAAKK